ncbi:hypothetical protein EVAR_93109_1 [Eumeta japonica]|uniref:Uncharacterized protein n=1 Tax=Eumeta variegata TaxID=151549 RepID=A0A4C1TGA8_EUMVA|nr:hypothetical protein EVAR_93109_1 [Eumeta japonica]
MSLYCGGPAPRLRAPVATYNKFSTCQPVALYNVRVPYTTTDVSKGRCPKTAQFTAIRFSRRGRSVAVTRWGEVNTYPIAPRVSCALESMLIVCPDIVHCIGVEGHSNSQPAPGRYRSNELVAPLGLPVSMDGDDHLLFDGSPACLSLEYEMKRNVYAHTQPALHIDLQTTTLHKET